MAKSAGWYDDEFGVLRWWTGTVWDSAPPGGDLQSPRGWYRHSDLWRWWTGSLWQPVYCSPDGAIDAGARIGQDLIVVSSSWGGVFRAVELLRAVLVDYPPVTITSIDTSRDFGASGLSLTALVEWESPAAPLQPDESELRLNAED
ncbi:MAG: hypothetical protein RI885_2370 [Actinomycetota bacterium]